MCCFMTLYFVCFIISNLVKKAGYYCVLLATVEKKLGTELQNYLLLPLPKRIKQFVFRKEKNFFAYHYHIVVC